MFQPCILATWKIGATPWLYLAVSSPASPCPAQAEADSIFPRPRDEQQAPGTAAGSNYDARLIGLKDYVSGKLRQSLIVLWCAVGMILLIVCVNLSNLLLARAAARAKEFAMRTALGAGRARIVRQLLTESLVLSLSGAVLGWPWRGRLSRWLAHQGSIALPLLSSLRIDSASLAWTLLIAMLPPRFSSALRPVCAGLQRSTNPSSRITGWALDRGKRHDARAPCLVVSEIALACVLLVGAGLLLRSFLHVLDVDLGFEPIHAAAISVSYDDSGGVARRE